MEKNKFRFRYSVIVWILLSAVSVLLAFGTAKNIYDFFILYDSSTSRAIFCAAIAFACLFLLVISVSVLVYGKYTVKEGKIYIRLGLFLSSIKTEDVSQISYFKKQDKLVLYLKNGKYTVAVIKSEEYSDFIAAVKRENPTVAYVMESGENN